MTLDQWSTAPGDKLPQFMEAAIRDNGPRAHYLYAQVQR